MKASLYCSAPRTNPAKDLADLLGSQNEVRQWPEAASLPSGNPQRLRPFLKPANSHNFLRHPAIILAAKKRHFAAYVRSSGRSQIPDVPRCGSPRLLSSCFGRISGHFEIYGGGWRWEDFFPDHGCTGFRKCSLTSKPLRVRVQTHRK